MAGKLPRPVVRVPDPSFGVITPETLDRAEGIKASGDNARGFRGSAAQGALVELDQGPRVF